MRAPPRSSRLPLFVTLACLIFFVGWLGLQIVARSGHEQTRALLAGVGPGARVMAEEHVDFGYPSSPWLDAVALVARHVPVDEAGLAQRADAIAHDVGWWMLAETRQGDLDAAERALWANNRADRLALRIAEALVDHGVTLGSDRPFPERYRPDALRLDGDGIVHLLLHVAWRLDLDVVAEAAPLRLYPVFREPGGSRRLHVEPTGFEKAADNPRAFVVDRHHPRRVRDDVPMPEDADAAGLFQPLDPRTLTDELTAHIAYGLLAAGVDVDPLTLLEPRLSETRSTRAVSLTHRWLVLEAESALSRGSPELAALRAARAMTLRRTHGPHHLWTRPDENRWMSDAMVRLRRDPAAMAALDRAISTGPGPSAVCEVLAPLGDELSTLLPSCDPPVAQSGG